MAKEECCHGSVARIGYFVVCEEKALYAVDVKVPQFIADELDHSGGSFDSALLIWSKTLDPVKGHEASAAYMPDHSRCVVHVQWLAALWPLRATYILVIYTARAVCTNSVLRKDRPM